MKRSIFIYFILFLIFSVFSCANHRTSITFDTLEPSYIDMSNYRNIAILATTPFSSYSYSTSYIPYSGGYRNDYAAYQILPYNEPNLATNIATYINDLLIDTLLSTNYYKKIITPPLSDSIYVLSSYSGNSVVSDQYEVDAYISSSIPDMITTSYIRTEKFYRSEIYRDKNGKSRTRSVPYYRYYLYQKVNVKFKFTVIDARTGFSVASQIFEKSYSTETEIKNNMRYAPSYETYFRKIFSGINQQIIKYLAPHKISTTITLMDNANPTINEYGIAWDHVKNTRFVEALNIFEIAWRNSRHVPSGYNAAIVASALGLYDKAYNIINEVYAVSPSNEVADRVAELTKIKYNTEATIRQM